MNFDPFSQMVAHLMTLAGQPMSPRRINGNAGQQAFPKGHQYCTKTVEN
jgi:hypothetical protein